MKLVILILKEEELLDKLIKKLNENNVHNITIFNSECVSSNGVNKNGRILNSLRYIMNYFYDESRILIIPIKEDEIDGLLELASEVLTKDKYMSLVLPIDRIEGSL